MNKHTILKWVKDNKISPEVGLELLKGSDFKEGNSNTYLDNEDQIVVVGISGRFPGADNVDDFWDILKNGKSSVSDIPKKRWDWDNWLENNSSLNELDSRMFKGGFIDNIAGFDEMFFGISKNEASYMDPSQRIFIQEAWKAFEDAGCTEEYLYGKSCGVFVGCQETDYLKYYDGAISPYISTGSSKSVIASRISYYLNLKGPAVSVDTACSSSLSALNIACQSIIDGSCDMALVGGMLTMSTPAMFTGLASLGMFSPDGCCRPFDDNANGTVIGEAVGAVVLKRLKDAERDGNYIYGIIKKVGWNQDGKTSGITAPNAVSQTALETNVYKRAGITPESISYIEAHGTGTKLGDPIEIQALTDAFSKFTDKKGFCAIGSVKANIGHTMPAAGIVSLIKVLLCLKNKKIVPSVNFSSENAMINFKNTPFYVNKELKEWETPKGEPRRAAISSFGFSGTNCHVIVEEYIDKRNNVLDNKGETNHFFPFSAKNKKALKQKETDMLEWLEKNSDNVPVEFIEYTLCNCRSHMKYRSCCIAKNVKELIRILRAHSANIDINGYYNESSIDIIPDNEYIQIAVSYIKDGKIEGLKFENKARRMVRLPDYPFVMSDYWISKIPKNENTNIISVSPEAYYATNHIVKGRKIIPGAMQLVWVLDSVEKKFERKAESILNVTWIQPVVAEPDLKLTISFEKEEELRCELRNKGAVLQSEISFEKTSDEYGFDVETIKKNAKRIITHEECYEYYKNRGLDYRDGFNSINTIYANTDRAFAEIENPDFIMMNKGNVLCTVIDAAFQTVMGIIGDGIQKTETVSVPFFMERIDFVSVPTKKCGIYAELSNNTKLKKYDLFVINDNGELSIRIKNFAFKPLTNDKTKKTEVPSFNNELLYFKPALKETSDVKAQESEQKSSLLIFNDKAYMQRIADQLEKEKCNCKCISYNAINSINEDELDYENILFVYNTEKTVLSLKSVSKKVNNIIVVLFGFIQKLLKNKTKHKIVYNIVGNNTKDPVIQSLDGLALSLNAESLKTKMKIVEWSDMTPLSSDLFSELVFDGTYILRAGNKRYTQVLCEEKSGVKENTFIKNGLYVISGGSGCIAQKIAEYLSRKYSSDVVLLGRRGEDEVKITDSSGIRYIQCDITDAKKVNTTFENIKLLYNNKKINGIIQCAGILNDDYIIKKDISVIMETLKPKVEATVILYNKAVEENIERLILFSSVASVFGNAGQSDYAYANSFLNHFSAYADQKITKVNSLIWPLWEEGGMQAQGKDENRRVKETGLSLLTDKMGMTALENVLSDNAQTIILSGDRNIIKEKIGFCFESECLERKEVSMEKVNDTVVNDEHINKCLLDELMRIASDFVNGCDEEIGEEDDIQDYGFDSVTLTAYCNAINDQLKIKITPASFFELDEPNIKSLRDYIKDLFGEKIAARYAGSYSNSAIEDKATDPVDSDASDEGECEEVNIDAALSDDRDKNFKTAIIGMNAILPKSDNIAQYWKNLLNNENMVSEFLADREVYLRDVNCIKRAGFMSEVDKFDYEFFNISPREAGNLDPQVRIILELIWKTFEDAGYDPKDYAGKKVGIFLGISSSDYCDLLIKAETTMDASVTVGISNSLRANRLSFAYDFRGPSEPIDTACSSSLIAVHHGVEALKSGYCDLAIAAGVNVILTSTLFNSFNGAGMLSKNGKCSTFDENADGYVRGEGAGAVLLKPLSEAEKDKDDIYSVICATASNHGGHAKSITSPNAQAQAQLIYDAYVRANFSPDTITYIETHGTGTQIGDPIEINGLKKAFSMLFEKYGCQPKYNYCGLGAVKSNIGHLEAASGIAGLIKTVMSIKNHKIPASINYSKLNPYIELENSPFYIVSENQKWNRIKQENGTEIPLRAGISSFGYGGSNAHIVLEEYVDDSQKTGDETAKERLYVFSAKKQESLNEYLKKFAGFIENNFSGTDSINDLNAVKNFIADALNVSVDEVDENSNFSEFNFDQIIINKLSEELSEHFNKKITAQEIIEYGNIRNLINSLDEDDKCFDSVSSEKIEYVLKCGRNHMNVRIAVIAESLSELKQNINEYLNGDISRVFTQTSSPIGSNTKLSDIAKRYVAGEKINFKEEYKEHNPGKAHLPTYCFERNRCWFEESKNGIINNTVNKKCLDLVNKNVVLKESADKKISLESKTLVQESKKVNMENKVKKTDALKVKQEIKQMVADVLYIDINKLDDNKAFMELGLDSILGVELVRKLKEKYKVDIKATKIYDYSNINKLSEYISDILAQASDDADNEVFENKTVYPEIKSFEAEKYKNVSLLSLKVPEKTAESVNENVEVERFDEATDTRDSDIAVIGMSIRFPKSKDVDELWKNLIDGRDCVTEIPDERWNSEKFADDKDMYCKWGGFVSDVDKFDPLFFNISPADAEVMDPQQRIFIMEVWKALEDAGYSKEKLDEANCGIYAGVMSHSEYSDSLYNSHSMLASRAAYYLNLKGPAIAIDTACSSSLVATHLACRSLIDGDADMMIAGGVTLYLSPQTYKGMGAGNMLAHDGKCKTFSDSADGFVPGEGVSVVVLKLLRNAIADGDQIYGVIKGSGINQDGRTNGITAPSAMSQTQLECNVYNKYGIDPENIQYVECHGTGTKLGDPIEIDALTDSFRKYTDKKQYCRIGSMKSGFGHTSAASGVGSLIKVLLSMKHGLIPPTINYDVPNSHIDFENSPFIVNDKLTEWKTDNGHKKCAAVSAFGYSGTNAHIVVEEYVDNRNTSANKGTYIIPVSGKSDAVVDTRVKDLELWVKNNKESLNINDVCYTLTQHRSHFNKRVCFVASDISELLSQFEDYINGVKNRKVILNNEKAEKSTGYMEKQLQKFIIDQLHSNADDTETEECYLALADMYVRGYDIYWEKIYGEKSGKVISAPAYPFDLKSYWIKQKWEKAYSATSGYNDPLCGEALHEAGSYSLTLTGKERFIEDNVVYGKKVVPGVAYLEMVKSSLENDSDVTVTQIKDLYWLDMIDVNNGEQTVTLKTDEKNGTFEIFSGNERKLNAKGLYSCDNKLLSEYEKINIPVNDLIKNSVSCLEGEKCYSGYKERLFVIGDSLKTMKKLYYTENEAISVLELPQDSRDLDIFKLPPAIMDAVLQTATGLQINMESSELGKPYISFCIGEVVFVRKIEKKCYAYAKLSEVQQKSSKYRSFDIMLLDREGNVLVVIKNFGIKQPEENWKVTTEDENKQEKALKNVADDVKEIYKKDIIEVIKNVLKIKDYDFKLDLNEELLNYGFSSITLIQFIDIVNKKYSINADTSIFFDDNVLTADTIIRNLYQNFEKEINIAYFCSEKETETVHDATECVQEEKKSRKIVTIKEIYDIILKDIKNEFKGTNFIKDKKINQEAIANVENYISEKYALPLENCKIDRISSIADAVKNIVVNNKNELMLKIGEANV